MINTSEHTGRRWAAGLLSVAALGALALAGCQPQPGTTRSVEPSVGHEIVITEDDIVRLGAQTAWDAVRLRVPKIVFSQGTSGQPTNMRIQETRTITGDQSPLLVVDGAQVSDVMYLRDIPASDVHVIRVLEEQDAVRRYGLAGFNGAIVIEMKHGGR